MNMQVIVLNKPEISPLKLKDNWLMSEAWGRGADICWWMYLVGDSICHTPCLRSIQKKWLYVCVEDADFGV